jgi:hypothetical protein
MTKNKDDRTPPPPGGRAAERLREFERARGLEPEQFKKGTKPAPGSDAADESAREGAQPPSPEKRRKK